MDTILQDLDRALKGVRYENAPMSRIQENLPATP